MNVLVLNSGSSSVKFQFIRMEDEGLLAKGIVEKIGSSDAIVTYQPEGRNKIREIREVLNHSVAIEMVLRLLLSPQHGVIRDKSEISGIGHRVVHGGEDFSDSGLVTEKVKASIRKCIQFAPLHNPHNLKGIEACEALLAGVPQVGVFDTAFHQTIPPKAFIYGLPYTLYKKLGIRRYGFHGTFHGYVAAKAMNLYLIRHGEAEQTSENKPHELRGLTENGAEIVRTSAEFWKNFVLSFDIILSFPLKRAKQTADIFRFVLKIKPEVAEEIFLLNGGLTEDLLSIAEAFGMNDIAMVGHQPDIGIHIASMIGSNDSNFKIPPSAIAKIHFKENPKIGKGILEFLLPPINKKG